METIAIPKKIQMDKGRAASKSVRLLGGIGNTNRAFGRGELLELDAFCGMLGKYRKIEKMEEKLAEKCQKEGIDASGALGNVSEIKYDAARTIAEFGRGKLGAGQGAYEMLCSVLKQTGPHKEVQAPDTKGAASVFAPVLAMIGGIAGALVGHASRAINIGLLAGAAAGFILGPPIAKAIINLKNATALRRYAALKAAAERIMKLVESR